MYERAARSVSAVVVRFPDCRRFAERTLSYSKLNRQCPRTGVVGAGGFNSLSNGKLRENFLDGSCGFDAGQTLIQSLEREGEFLMLNAHAL